MTQLEKDIDNICLLNGIIKDKSLVTSIINYLSSICSLTPNDIELGAWLRQKVDNETKVET